MARIVFRSFPISLPNRVTWVDLVELYVSFILFLEWIGFMPCLLPFVVEQV